MFMKQYKNINSYVTANEMKSFNQRINVMLESAADGIGEDVEFAPQQAAPEQASPDNPNFDYQTTSPENIDDTTLYQLADLVDGKVHYEDNNESDEVTDFASPNTVDQIDSSIGVMYISSDSIPIGVATIIDPTVENYKGIIPVDYYELKSGQELYGRIQLEFFAVKPEFKAYESELYSLITEVAPDIYAVTPESNGNMMTSMKSLGLKPVSKFNTDWDITPVILWIN